MLHCSKLITQNYSNYLIEIKFSMEGPSRFLKEDNEIGRGQKQSIRIVEPSFKIDCTFLSIENLLKGDVHRIIEKN